MQILNPIYDVVFKYMMEDNKVAKLFLSVLIGQEILELKFLPQELIADFQGDISKIPDASIQLASGLTIYRMDFSARIRTENNEEKLIIIEVQKSKLTADMLRFRTYLGRQYANKEYFQWVIETGSQRPLKAGIPIYAIFFLGYGLKEYQGIPIIEIDTCVKDRYSQEKLDERGSFIPSLFHKGLIINIPFLREKYRNDLEKILSIFDQQNRSEDFHILNVKEEYFEERYRPIIRRLQSGIMEKQIRDKIIAEEDFLSELNDYEERISKLEKQKEQETQRAEQEKQRAEQEKQRAEQEKQRAEQEKQRAEQEKQRAEQLLQDKINAVKMMLEMNISPEIIKEKMNVDDNFLGKYFSK